MRPAKRKTAKSNKRIHISIICLAVAAGLTACAVFAWHAGQVRRASLERKISHSIISYFHFQNINGGDYNIWNKRGGRWDASRPRKVRYLQSPDGKTALILCESFQDNQAERLISECVATDFGRIFLTIRLDGEDSQIDIYFGHPSWLESKPEWNARVLAYVNDKGYVRSDTGCPKGIMREFIDGRGESQRIAWNGFLPALASIREFTLPPLASAVESGLLSGNIKRLPASFEKFLQEAIEGEDIEWGLAVVSPSAQSSVKYEGIILHSKEYSRQSYFEYYKGSMFKIAHSQSHIAHPTETLEFPNVGHHYMKLRWFPSPNDSGPFSSILAPFLRNSDLMDAAYILGDIAIAYKYSALGAVYVFSNTDEKFTIVRIK